MRLKFERLAFDSNAAIALLRPERTTPPPFAEARSLVMPLFVLAELELGRSRQSVKSPDVLSGLVAACTILAPDRNTIAHYAASSFLLQHLVDRWPPGAVSAAD